MKRTASSVAIFRVWSPKKTFFGARLQRTMWKKRAHCLWMALAKISAMPWLPSNFLIQVVPVKRFDQELEVSWWKKWQKNMEHIQKGDVVTHYLLTEKLFLSQKYDLLRKVWLWKMCIKKWTCIIAKKKSLFSFNFALPCSLKSSVEAVQEWLVRDIQWNKLLLRFKNGSKVLVSCICRGGAHNKILIEVNKKEKCQLCVVYFQMKQASQKRSNKRCDLGS